MQKDFRSLPILMAVSLALSPCLFGLKSSQAAKSPTTAERRMESWEEHVRMENESPFKNLRWRAVGPKKQGGRIEAIACPRGNSTTIYVGAGAGNIWKTYNNGTTWQPIFEHESTFAVGALAVAPSDPAVVWVGTGENLMARSSFAGNGVFKSNDGGLTWENMGLKDSHHIGKIVIHPNNPDIVYVAALGHQYTFNPERGLFKTTDGGQTWKRSLFISERVGVVDVVMDPEDSQILYASAWERDRKAWNNVVCGAGSGIYKTTDAGSNWERLTEGFPTGPFIGRIGLAGAPSNPDVLYATLDNRSPRFEGEEEKKPAGVVGGEVYRSEDKGESWEKVNLSELMAGINYAFGDIRISPEDENIVYVLGVNLAVSVDGGRTFQKLGGTVVHLLEHPTRALHLDQHDLWIDPENPERLILGNDGGVYLSNDRGQNWLHVNNLPIAEFYAISVDSAEPYRIYGGTQDNAALYGPGYQSLEVGIADPWQLVWIDLWGGGDSYFTLIDPTDNKTVYYEQQFGAFKRKDLRTGRSETIQPRAQKGEPDLRYNWMSPFLISHHNPYTLYFGANKLFKSINRGDNWSAISPDLTTNPGPEKQGNVPYGTITSIAESPLRPGLLYVGTDDGNVHITRDDGVSWKRITDGLPSKWISRVVASSHDLGTAYMTLTGFREDDFETYVFKSDNFGLNWTSIAEGLPAESVNVLREDPQNENILYVGTDHGGVYVSLDGGQVWHSLSAQLPTTPVHDMAVQSREKELIIGTHGRSAFVLDIAPIQIYDRALAKKEVHLFPIRPARLPRSRDYFGDWALETRQEAVIHYYLKESRQVEILILDESGDIVQELSGTNDPGINRAVWDLSPIRKEVNPVVYERASPLVRPGEYRVVIQAGKIRTEGLFQVIPSSR